MPGQSKGRGRQTEPCSCPPEQNKALPGASEEDRGTGCTLNGPLCSPSETFRITQHPIVVQVTVLHTHPLPIPTNHTFTFTTPPSSSRIHTTLFLHSFTPSFSWLLRLVFILRGGRKGSLRHKWMERLRHPHPPFLQAAADSGRQTLHVQPPKHSTCHSSLTGC